MNITKCFVLPALALLAISSCKKSESNDDPTPTGPYINFVFKFDSTQARLNNLGAVSTIPAGNDAQSPKFNVMSAHYVELTPDQFTGLGAGAVLYKAPETTAGGANAIDFSKSTF